MKNKCIIFGAGIAGRTAYYKLSLYLNIVAYADNNHSLWGTELNGIKIINPDVISNLGDVTVIICSDYYPEIAERLAGLCITDVYIVAHKNFVKEYGVGMEVNLDAPIYPQLKQISEMKIYRHLLTRKKLTFNSHAEELIRFYSNL